MKSTEKPARREPTPADWRKELIGGLAYKATKRSYDISTGKYLEPLRTKKYWIEAGKNLSKGISGFLQAVTGMPGRQEEEEARLAAMRGTMGEERPSPAKVAGIIGKEEIASAAFSFMNNLTICIGHKDILLFEKAGHTSMTTGDYLVFEDGEIWIAADQGWKIIKKET